MTRSRSDVTRRALLLSTLGGLCLAAIPHPAHAAYELYPGERLQGIALPLKGPLTLSGWTRDGRGVVYSLQVEAGQSFRFQFKPRNRFVGLVIFDEAGEEEDELFSVQGTEADQVLKAEKDTVWIIRPYYARMSPRRGMGAPYAITITPQ